MTCFCWALFGEETSFCLFIPLPLKKAKSEIKFPRESLRVQLSWILQKKGVPLHPKRQLKWFKPLFCADGLLVNPRIKKNPTEVFYKRKHPRCSKEWGKLLTFVYLEVSSEQPFENGIAIKIRAIKYFRVRMSAVSLSKDAICPSRCV